jgi:hypothetical protein
MNSILAFWFAYVVTRPLGASLADWLGVSSGRGGLGIGTGLVSLVLAAMIAMFVAFLTSTEIDLPEDQKRAGERGYTATADFAPPSQPTRLASRPDLSAPGGARVCALAARAPAGRPAHG